MKASNADVIQNESYNSKLDTVYSAELHQTSRKSRQPSSITSPNEVHQVLAKLSIEAGDLEIYLQKLHIDSAEKTVKSREVVGELSSQINIIIDEARVLNGRLAKTGDTAVRINASVKRLDDRYERLELAKSWTEKVADLKASLQSMAACIEQKDFVSATHHCERILSIDSNILYSNFAEIIVPSSEYPESPPALLLSLRKILLNIFTERFEEATHSKDTVEATKYFTMFPKAGWRSEGLIEYSKFAKSLVREIGQTIREKLGAERSEISLYHASLLTLLFENLALLIHQHQPLVDRHYGSGSFTQGIMPGLQEECDRIGKQICDTWYDERYVRRKIVDVKAYKFDYLASIGTTQRKGTSALHRNQAGFSVTGRSPTPFSAQDTAADTYQLDTREIDRIVSELAAMSTRWGTYRRFLLVRLESSKKVVTTQNKFREELGDLKDFRKPSEEIGRDVNVSELTHTINNGEISAKDSLVETSVLGQRLHSLMETVFLPLESWFLRRSIEKAHQMNVLDIHSRPLTSPLLDDVFYLVRMVLNRSVSASDLTILSTMSRHIRYIVDEDFIQAIVRILDGSSRTASGSMVVEGPRKDAASREMRTTFGIYLNVLSTSADYTTRILDELSVEANLRQYFAEDEVVIAASTIQGLSGLVPRIRNVVRTYVDLLFSTLLRPKLRQLVADSLRDVHYVLDEVAYSRVEDEANANGGSSTFIRRLSRGWEAVVNSVGYDSILTKENWEMILRLSIDTIVLLWEEWIMSNQYSELGALQFDKDLRTIATFLSNQSPTGGLRERFSRLTHISYLLNVDEDDSADDSNFGGEQDSALAWRLDTKEVEKVRQLRVGW